MSTDVLRRHISRHLDFLRTLQGRGLPPITCVFSRLEGEPPDAGYRLRFSPLPHHEGWPAEAVMTDAAFHPSLGVAEPYVSSSHWGNHGGNYVTVFAAMPSQPDPFEDLGGTPTVADPPADRRHPVLEAIQVTRQVCERLSPLARELPARLAERLGFVRTDRRDDWVEVLFHLGWHFPAHGIDAGRFRILSGADGFPDFRCPEGELQLGGVRTTPDVFPGVVVSRLGQSSDFLTASICALQLILEALDGIERGARPQPGEEFGPLRDSFMLQAEALSHHPRNLTAQVLRLADSFRTPPATGWAGIERGGDGWGIPRYFVLSHLNADRVVCVLRGPALEAFLELADRAGSLLPCWPSRPYPALLNDVGALARARNPADFPWTVHLGDVWNRGMVTDHRGNVERWLGFVFGLLMANSQEDLHLATRPEDVTRGIGVEPANAMLTLRGMNLLAASARAIERAGLAPQQRPLSSPTHMSDAQELPTPRVTPNPGTVTSTTTEVQQGPAGPPAPPRPIPVLWQPVIEQFNACCRDNEPHPFLCLIRFENPDDSALEAGDRFAAQKAADVCWPRILRGYPEGRGPTYERVQLGTASDGSLREMVCVYDRDMDGRGIGRYYTLAAQAAALLPASVLSHPDLITQRGIPCTGRTPFREADRWTWFVFRSLHAANLLRSQLIPEVRAEAFWFAGAAFAASAAALRLEFASTTDPPAETGLIKKTGRRPDDRKQAVVSYVRELRGKNTPWKKIPEAVFKKFKIRYTSETLRGYLKSG